jgi:hypothetical protein
MSNEKKENLKLFIKKLKIMRGYFGLGQLSATEKSDILNQHKSLYNGYQTMQPQYSNTQPLTVYDFAGDKDGIVVNNKGEVKKYTNMGINEQVEEKEMCEQCGGTMRENVCEQCGSKMEGEVEEGVGKLDDIYDEQDLDPTGGFDYIEGPSNDVDTFEGMHKNLYREDEYEDTDNEDDGFEDIQAGEEMGEDETDDKPYEKGKLGMKASRARASFEPTPKEKDILEKLFGQYGDDIPPIVIRYLRKLPRKVFTKRLIDLNLIDKNALNKLDEQGYTGGGNAPDMDLSNIEPAYDFISNGPDEVYPTEEMDEQCLDCVEEYETMESAWSEEEIDEVDVSGSQGIYGDMEKAYDFDSEGPGKAGPYQRSSYNEGETDEQYLPKHAWKHMARQQAAKDKGEDFDPNEFDPSDYEGLDSLSSWEDIKSYFGDSDWSEVDEDLQESFISQKNKVMEMMNRMKVIK